MRRLRTHKSLVLVILGVGVFAAFLPVVSPLFAAVLIPLWLVLPATIVTLVRRAAVRCDEQTVSLLSLLLSRAPPAVRVLS
jgi:hypothetical protein